MKKFISESHQSEPHQQVSFHYLDTLKKNTTSQISGTLQLSLVTQFFPPDYAPTGQLLEELVQELVRLGVQVQVFTGQPGYAFHHESAQKIERSPNLLIRRSSTSRLWFQRIRGKAISGLLFWLRAALHILKNENCKDVLLLTTAPPFLPILGYLAYLIFRRPYICLLYDLYPDIAIALNVIPKNHWLVRLWQIMNYKTWRTAEHIIVLSSTMRDRIVEQCPDVADKISIIHNWANPDHIVPISKQQNWFARQYGLIEKFTVLYSGNMGRCHDIDTIIQTAICLKDEPIQFVFIGDGAKREAAIAQVDEFKLQNVLFLPYQDKQTLPYSLTACDLSLVSIDVDMEGLIAPSKLYSAMAGGCAIAVIAEPHSYLRQILLDAQCGQVFSSGDVTELTDFIRKLAKYPELSEKMGTSGRQYLQQHFTLEHITQQYYKILWSFLAK